MEFYRGRKRVKTTSVSGVKLRVDIPEWLLVEVLVRLPVKQVFRAKLVSKQWLSVILDPSFIRVYISRASAMPQSQIWTFLEDTMYADGFKYSLHSEYDLLEDVYSQDLKSPNLLALRCPINTYPHVKKYEIGGVSNGLVLYGPHFDMNRCLIYNIYNPITGQWISLPPYTRCSTFDACSFVTRVENGVLLSYRVVLLNVPLEASNIVRFKVFVSETNEWKNFDVCIDQEVEFTRRNPTTFNGILHWKTREHGIIAYDPYQNSESLRLISLPRDIDPKNDKTRLGIFSLCDAHQGSLRYFEVSGVCFQSHGFSSFGVWILNDYNTEEWSLQHKIYSNDILYDDVLFGKRMYLTPLSFHPFDPQILYLGYKDIIVSYNFKTRKLEAHGGLRLDIPKCPCWWTALTFVVPPWPTAITSCSDFNV